MFGLAFIVGPAVLAPRIGVAFWVGATLTGTLLAGVPLDHLGAFGTTATPASPARLAGIRLLLAGLPLSLLPLVLHRLTVMRHHERRREAFDVAQ